MVHGDRTFVPVLLEDFDNSVHIEVTVVEKSFGEPGQRGGNITKMNDSYSPFPEEMLQPFENIAEILPPSSQQPQQNSIPSAGPAAMEKARS